MPCFRECLKPSIDLSTFGADATVKDDGAKTRNRQSSVRPRRTETRDRVRPGLAGVRSTEHLPEIRDGWQGVLSHSNCSQATVLAQDKNVAGRIDPASDPCCNNHTHAEAYAPESHLQPLNAIVPPVSETGRPSDRTTSRPEVTLECRLESRPGMRRNNQTSRTSRRRIQINQ